MKKNTFTYTHADDRHKYYKAKQTLVTKNGRLQTKKLFSTKVSVNYAFDAIGRGLTDADYNKILLVLAQYINDDSELYYYNKKLRRQVPMTKNDMAEILGMSKNYFSKFYKRCTNANIFKLHKWISNENVTRQAIYVNPAFIQTCFTITPLAYWLFRQDLIDILDDTTIAIFDETYYKDYGVYNKAYATEFLAAEETEEDIFTDSVSLPLGNEINNNDLVNAIEAVSDYEEEYKQIFADYVLNGKPADIYSFDGVNQYFLANESHTAGKRSKSDIKTYRNLFIDIDAGKKDGEYLPMNEVNKRKEDMLKVVHSFGVVPTCINETRNGYHVIYAINPVFDYDTWQAAQDALVDAFNGVADKAVRDSSRLLRLPYSVWQKGDNEAFTVKIQDANAVRHNINYITTQLYLFEDEIKEACAAYVAKYPDVAKEAKENKKEVKVNRADKAAASVSVSTNQRIEDIKKLNYIDLGDSIELNQRMLISDFKSYVKRYNLGTFLNLPVGEMFCCVLHNDKSPSANILKNDDGYRYFCFSPNCEGHGDGHGADIINVVQELSGADFYTAIKWLAAQFKVILM